MRTPLSRLPISLKVLITAFVLALAVGYLVALLQVANRTGIDIEKTILHFRGSESEGEVFVRQSDATLLSVAHVHTFSQPVVLGMMGLLFALTGLSESVKVLWILISFIGSLMSNVGPWIIRDLSPHYVYPLYLSGTAMVVGFLVMATAILCNVWRKERDPHV